MDFVFSTKRDVMKALREKWRGRHPLQDLVFAWFVVTPSIVTFWYTTEHYLSNAFLARRLPRLEPAILFVTSTFIYALIHSNMESLQRWTREAAVTSRGAVDSGEDEGDIRRENSGLSREDSGLSSSDSIGTNIHRQRNRTALPWQILSRGYNYTIAICNVAQMRAVTLLWQRIVGSGVHAGAQAFVTSTAALFALRVFRNIATPPLYIATDYDKSTFFEMSSLLKTTVLQRAWFFTDQLLTAAIVHSTVHLHWLGVWSLLDYIFPTTSWSSILLGLVLGLVGLCAVEGCDVRCSRYSSGLEHMQKLQQVLFEDAFMVLGNAFCVCIWRSYWLLSSITCEGHVPLPHMTSFCLLVLVQCTRSLVLTGCEFDGETSGLLFSRACLTLLKQQTDQQVSRQRSVRRRSREAAYTRLINRSVRAANARCSQIEQCGELIEERLAAACAQLQRKADEPVEEKPRLVDTGVQCKRARRKRSPATATTTPESKTTTIPPLPPPSVIRTDSAPPAVARQKDGGASPQKTPIAKSSSPSRQLSFYSFLTKSGKKHVKPQNNDSR